LNILIIGSGAREHALAWKVSQSSKVTKIYVAPGNAGTATIAQNLPIKPTDITGLCNTAHELDISLTIVGSEAPLAAGIVDLFEQKKLPIVGPTKKAAQIESSKVFAKKLMQESGIPTAAGEIFTAYKEARKYVASQKPPLVIKADGLAAGKGDWAPRHRSVCCRWRWNGAGHRLVGSVDGVRRMWRRQRLTVPSRAGADAFQASPGRVRANAADPAHILSVLRE